MRDFGFFKDIEEIHTEILAYCLGVSTVDVTKELYNLACLGRADGGGGLTFIEEVATAAYVASYTAALKDICEESVYINDIVQAKIRGDAVDSSVIPIELQCYFDGIDTLANSGSMLSENDKVSLKMLWELNEFKGLQKKLYVSLYEMKKNQVIEEILSRNNGLLVRKLFTSGQGMVASAWLFSIPTSSYLQMSPSQFSISLRNRFFVKHPMVDTSIICSCNESIIDGYGYHVHLCSTYGVNRTKTHDSLVGTLGNMLEAAGITYRKEIVIAKEKRYDKDKGVLKDPDKIGYDNKRLDIVTKIPVSLLEESTAKITTIDVTVVNAARNQKLLTKDAAEAVALEANKAEDYKINKYKQLVSEHDSHIIPFALESQGQFGKKTSIIFNKLVDLVLLNSRAKRSVLFDYWAKRFSIVLQKGVADHLVNAFRSIIKRDICFSGKDSVSNGNVDRFNHPIEIVHWMQFSQY